MDGGHVFKRDFTFASSRYLRGCRPNSKLISKLGRPQILCKLSIKWIRPLFTYSQGEVHPPPNQRCGQGKEASLLSLSVVVVVVEYFLVYSFSVRVLHIRMCVCVCVAAQFHFFTWHRPRASTSRTKTLALCF